MPVGAIDLNNRVCVGFSEPQCRVEGVCPSMINTPQSEPPQSGIYNITACKVDHQMSCTHFYSDNDSVSPVYPPDRGLVTQTRPFDFLPHTDSLFLSLKGNSQEIVMLAIKCVNTQKHVHVDLPAPSKPLVCCLNRHRG